MLVGVLVGVLVLMLVLMLVELGAQVGRRAQRGPAVSTLGGQETGVKLLTQQVLFCFHQREETDYTSTHVGVHLVFQLSFLKTHT